MQPGNSSLRWGCTSRGAQCSKYVLGAHVPVYSLLRGVCQRVRCMYFFCPERPAWATELQNGVHNLQVIMQYCRSGADPTWDVRAFLKIFEQKLKKRPRGRLCTLFSCVFRQVAFPRTLCGTFSHKLGKNRGMLWVQLFEIFKKYVFWTILFATVLTSYLPPPYKRPPRGRI